LWASLAHGKKIKRKKKGSNLQQMPTWRIATEAKVGV
jgi:hypothetical protein